MPRARDPNSLRSLAAEYGVAVPALVAWRDAGCDIKDRAAVAEFRKQQTGEDFSNEPENITEARRIKVMEETRLLRLKIQVEEGKLVPIEQVEEAGVRIGVVCKQGLLRLENDLPPMLEGLSAARMKKVLRGTLRNMLREWEDFSEEAVEDAQSAD